MEKIICECGAAHAECVTKTAYGNDAAARLCGWLAENNYKNIFIVCDVNTKFAADGLIRNLRNMNCDFYCFGDAQLSADEAAVGKILLSADKIPKPDALVAVGAGTLNDLTRYAASRLTVPYYVFATAASMDGYASALSALSLDGLKLTYFGDPPQGVAADPQILCGAPREMTAAGYGDIAGKFISTAEWELENLITGEAYCPVLASEMRGVAESCAADPSPQNIMDSLVRSGLIMQKNGNSKPASCSEHHLSHFWEMKALLRGERPALHGAKVGVGSLVIAKLVSMLINEKPDWVSILKSAESFDKNGWARETRSVFGKAADGVLSLWRGEDNISRLEDAKKIRESWSKTVELLRERIPPYEKLFEGLSKAGCPVSPREINVGRSDFVDAVKHAYRIRKRFTILRVADVLGLLPAYSESLADFFVE